MAPHHQNLGFDADPSMRRRALLRAAGLGITTLATAGVLGLGYRAYDQGVLEAGQGPAYAPWSLWERGADLLRLVRAAVLAPSPHNAQPWLFALGPDHVDVYADPTRRTGALDPFDRELHVGLGAAIENSVLAAGAIGRRAHVELMPRGVGTTHVARVTLTSSVARGSPLYAQIPTGGRTVTRSRGAHPSHPPPCARWRSCARSGARRSVSSGSPPGPIGHGWVSCSSPRRRKSSRIPPSGPATDVGSARIGTSSSAMPTASRSMPPACHSSRGRWPSSFPRSPSARSASRGWRRPGIATRRRRRHTGSSASGRTRRPTSSSSAGALQRVHLWATGAGLAVHHMNQVTERADRELQLGLRPTFGDAINQLVPDGWHPLASFRIGHPDPACSAQSSPPWCRSQCSRGGAWRRR